MTDFRLKIWRVEQTCIFELSWEAGLQITAQLAYPESLTTLYHAWQNAYINFYSYALRARVQGSGGITSPSIDWRAQLVQAEARFLSEFYFWLNSAELLGIRSQIAKAAIVPSAIEDPNFEATDRSRAIEVCLTCEPMELARFPWEAWEIGTEFGSNRIIRIARTPANLRKKANQRRTGSKLRILAILGDDTGLDFQTDKQAVQSLSNVATIEFVGWQAGKDTQNLKEEIAQAIADERGWDILFFAGHSNETSITGGELTIAPGVSILVQEIAPHLIKARDHGLQFAIFNSCSGLSIANSLVDLGLSQVAIMREPIHNRVAQEFLLRFLQHLSEYCDVHTAMLRACKFLKVDRNLTYPSAYLIPSLFRHPEAEPFQLQPQGFGHWIKPWLPNRRQAWILAGLAAVSLLPPLQNLILEPRIAAQAIYRHLTRQIPSQSPDVLLVQVDEDSIRGLDARKINPIDRTYLAQVIDKAQTLKPKVIGIDFLLDRPTNEDATLSQSVKAATQQGQWLLFAANSKSNGREIGAVPSIANPNWTIQGHIGIYVNYTELLAPSQSCYETCPFGYLLALTGQLQRSPQPFHPNLNSKTNARDQILRHIEQADPPLENLQPLLKTRLTPLSAIVENFGQLWLRPILDYSIPPSQAYQKISAGALLDGKRPDRQPVPPIVLIAPGGYKQAGISQLGEDNFSLPLALRYWGGAKANPIFTGAEAHAYMIHHFLHQRQVIPVPDLWMMGLAAIVGQGTAQYLKRRNIRRRHWVLGSSSANGLYGIAALQLYISSGLLLPILLPSAVFWLYLVK
ncbi:CHASE2 domain-containing protein [filamentous cyanobacterium LEGE 11480]|uniref:CHASE2 domain-containing protein n=1 Tax=Romeriopsis navalis LEGE 11480 TaxID=2777977 RepID=A0A928VIN8_9CYAN|nr:CHASE2 domain-containing protein [Romeriopsis navalis]MBE9028392.1 CHASE2 domain-containing protein [Romeriopsis navalis LEGE 11480]